MARWGEPVVGADGRLDRQALAAIVFADRSQLGELTAMAAPLTEQEIVRRALVHLGTDALVVVEAALYLAPMYGMTGLAVVDVPVEVAVSRLVAQRQMSEQDVSVQASRCSHRARSDSSTPDSSSTTAATRYPQLDRLCAWLQALPNATPTLERRPAGPTLNP